MTAKLKAMSPTTAHTTARPFLKWVGGKTQLLPELAARMPKQYGHYFEPFIGGGALFFYLRPAPATLTDINPDLIVTYQVIRDQVDALIQDLSHHRYERDYYYELRAVDRTPEYQNWSDVQKASRMIYLNKCCFNGLYRVNSKGEFNVPFGRYKAPNFLDADNLRACRRSLQNVDIQVQPFTAVEAQVQAHDFVYFDPPYAPLNATSNFTSYSSQGFDLDAQVALRDLCQRLHQRGVYFMVSNSSAPLIFDLYREFKIKTVMAARTVNSHASKRGKIPEVLVTNNPR